MTVLDAAGGNEDLAVFEYILNHPDYKISKIHGMKPAPFLKAVENDRLPIIKNYFSDSRFELSSNNFLKTSFLSQVMKFSPKRVTQFLLNETKFDFIQGFESSPGLLHRTLIDREVGFFERFLLSSRSRDEKLRLIALIQDPIAQVKEFVQFKIDIFSRPVTPPPRGVGLPLVEMDALINLESLEESLSQFMQANMAENSLGHWD